MGLATETDAILIAGDGRTVTEWTSHPSSASDVVSTAHGPIHIVVVDAAADRLDVRPSGAGSAVGHDDLDLSFRTAMVALQLCDGEREPYVDADRYTGIVDLLAETPDGRAGPDVHRMADGMTHTWAGCTVDAILNAPSGGAAGRRAPQHHAVSSRLDRGDHGVRSGVRIWANQIGNSLLTASIDDVSGARPTGTRHSVSAVEKPGGPVSTSFCEADSTKATPPQHYWIRRRAGTGLSEQPG